MTRALIAHELFARRESIWGYALINTDAMISTFRLYILASAGNCTLCCQQYVLQV